MKKGGRAFRSRSSLEKRERKGDWEPAESKFTKERMESGAPVKERRAGVARISEGFGSETARNGWEEEIPRRNE